MLRLENDRSCLYQWDVDQRLEVDNDEIREVHFANAVTSPALVCEVYEEGGRRFADVPNILLQQIWPIQAYGFCGSRVRDVLTCKVIRREKPADYVYTETEVKRFEDLEQRIEYLEQYGGGSGGSGGPGPAGPQGEPGKDGKDGKDGEPGKSAYQYAQDGGYTGTEAEFAQKLAQEIPAPYALPPATTETLGGVIVGDGLTVDEDGRVGVRPDNEFETIRTVTLEEAVGNIAFDNLNHTRVRLECILQNEGGDIKFPAGVIMLNGVRGIRLGAASLTAGEPMYRRIDIRIEEGSVRTISSYSRNQNVSYGTEAMCGNSYNIDVRNDWKKIESMSIMFSSPSDVLPAGTIFTLKGVRADA